MLENVSKGNKKNIEVIFLKSFKDKSLGAIGKDRMSALLIETRFGIHTFFLKRPLDIILLNKKGKVMKLKRNMEPNRLFFWNPKYNFIIEAPTGSINELDLEVGNILRFSL